MVRIGIAMHTFSEEKRMRFSRLTSSLVVPAAVMVVVACSGGGDGADTADNDVSFTSVSPETTSGETDTSDAEPEVDPCATGVISEVLDEGWEVAFCEDGWARTELPDSDGQNLQRWDGESWEAVEPAGETFTGFRGIDNEALIDEGAPEDLFGNITVCDPEDMDGESMGGDSTESTTNADCGEDPDSSVILEHISEVPAPSLEDLTWSYGGESNYDPCADLSYATVVQSEVGNAQFQNQLMLFHNGEYLGVGTDTVQQHSIVSTTDDSVTVKYKDYDALDASGEPNAAAPEYTTEVTYRWDGQRVVPEGRIPNQNR